MSQTDLQVAVVDLIDDLEVSGQEVFKHGHRPTLQGLWEYCMVCVGTRLGGYLPCLDMWNKKN